MLRLLLICQYSMHCIALLQSSSIANHSVVLGHHGGRLPRKPSTQANFARLYLGNYHAKIDNFITSRVGKPIRTLSCHENALGMCRFCAKGCDVTAINGRDTVVYAELCSGIVLQSRLCGLDGSLHCVNEWGQQTPR